jgi:SAM-dependent methyltransferase
MKPISQRKTEWIEQVDTAYHERQFHEPYRSTVAFCDWIESHRYIGRTGSSRILDVGCGQGANLFYMAKRFPHCEFIGVDINPALIESGNQILKRNGVGNARLEVGDLYEMSGGWGKLDGIISFQTLSWLPEYTKAVEVMAALGSEWIAASSLFYDGDVSCTIQVQDWSAGAPDPRESYYNIYSLPRFREFLSRHGFASFRHMPFEIDIDLPRPKHTGMGTWTQKLHDGRRIQVSGPLLMPWGFVAAGKQ